MQRGIFVAFAVAIVGMAFFATSARALSDHLMITAVQVDGVGAATQEYVEIYNGTDSDLPLDDYKLRLVPSTNNPATTKLIDLNIAAETPGTVLKSHGFALVASGDYVPVTGGIVDYRILGANSLSMTGAGVGIVDPSGNVVDKLAWGTVTDYEGSAPVTPKPKSPTPGLIMMRKMIDGGFEDTDNNASDFTIETAYVPRAGDVYELPVDVCANVEGVQSRVPTGMYLVDANCQSVASLRITELLPNPGAMPDAQGEYIELYNPGDAAVSLAGYVLQAGTNYSYSIVLTSGQVLPKSYVAVYASASHITLANSGGRVRLLAPDGSGDVVDEAAPYPAMGDDQAWALIGEIWQISDQATPEEANVLVIKEDGEGVVAGVTSAAQAALATACPEGKVRNPATNRCRAIVATSTASTAAQTACRDGYERNPATNRCRKIVTATTATSAACKDGYERNSETKRCRKIVATTHKAGASTNSSASPPAIAYAVGGLAIVGLVGYAVFEWRQELSRLFPRAMLALATR